ncbi:hypothetical protein VNO77_08257 [Canavalia gladiata]|uniref:Uncharacterized protein n=1 Tax=Canavalia gladiata TaxID=3824 RepID=A0AAN9MDU3_CANGL
MSSCCPLLHILEANLVCRSHQGRTRTSFPMKFQLLCTAQVLQKRKVSVLSVHKFMGVRSRPLHPHLLVSWSIV